MCQKCTISLRNNNILMSFLNTIFYKPYQTQLRVTSANGFHLRPVASFANIAKRFPCRIWASFKNKKADAKNINALLSLSLDTQDCFTLTALGRKAEEALEALTEQFSFLMQNDPEPYKIQKEKNLYEGSGVEGEIIADGIAVARLHNHSTQEILTENRLGFQDALKESLQELDMLHSLHQTASSGSIYLAQKELLKTLAQTNNTLKDFEDAIADASHSLKGTPIEAKISDYRDLLWRIKKHLGAEEKLILPATPFILVADDLLPGHIEQLTQSQAQGIVLKKTSLRSHTAILLRAAGIPSLIIVRPDDAKYDFISDMVILDAHAGILVYTPSQNDLQKAMERLQKNKSEKKQAQDQRFKKAVTAQGKPIHLFANVSDVKSAKEAKEEGAEGIGLLRSEFLFTQTKPSFEAQVHAYKEIFALFEDITVRTLDIGGDKALPYMQLPYESNPFLGVRGIRLLETHPEILEEQLHAIFIAAQRKPIKIMFPMVARTEEFIQAKAFAYRVAKKYGLDISSIRFGIMIEVPSVLFLLQQFNKVVDFYSVGTNDLNQYLFAIERTHPTLKLDAHSSVLFDALEKIVKEVAKPLSLCGELASNKEAIPKLVALGIETLSVSAKMISTIKEEIRHV